MRRRGDDAGDALPDQPAPKRPPTLPEAWADRDADLATQVALRGTPGEPFQSLSPCRCGGTWRYRLARLEHARIVRCLHCGEPLFDTAGSGQDASAG
jgi:hypothetical protein